MKTIINLRASVRGVLAAACSLVLVAGVAACSMNPGTPSTNTTVTVNLVAAQKQAENIDAAVAASLMVANGQMNATQQAKAVAAKQALDAAVAQFTAMPSGMTPLQLAKAVQDAIPTVVNAIPVIPPQDKLLIDLGVAVLDSFEANVPLSLPAPVAAAVVQAG